MTTPKHPASSPSRPQAPQAPQANHLKSVSQLTNETADGIAVLVNTGVIWLARFLHPGAAAINVESATIRNTRVFLAHLVSDEQCRRELKELIAKQETIARMNQAQHN